MNKMWEYFKCQQCGACCSATELPYEAESALKMAEFLKMTIEEIIENFYGEMSPKGSFWTSDDKKRTPCPFLRKSEEKYFCIIYSVRPEGCRAYPIDTDGGRQGINCPAWEVAFLKFKDKQEEGI